MNVYTDLIYRDLIKDVSDQAKVDAWFKNKGSIYIGFDPSFRSLHLGNYQTLMVLKRLALAGHPVYAVVGGITGLIGDPKPSQERQMQAIETIKSNAVALGKQLTKYAKAKKVCNNLDFYRGMTVYEYLRDIGKLININYILEKEIIARRLATGISYAEFSYTILQGYDFLYLFEHEKVTCQAGGSDQWGNITTGLEFIRKLHGQTPACCFSLNLLVKPDGTKFGKSESGAIYLDPTITSPYQMYQFLINQEDSMVEILLKRLTFFTKDEIEKILKTHQDNPALRFGQKQLAIAVTTDVHGARECEKAQKISQALFSGELAKLTNDELYVALTGTNVFDAELKEYPLIDLLVNAHVVPSKSEGRKLISQNSIYVNNQLITDFNQKISQRDGIGQKFSYLRKGKKQYFLINWPHAKKS